MAKRGRPRSAKNLPPHIEPGKLPDGIYWDPSGRGHWYTVRFALGKPSRKRVAGHEAQLSDLHAIAEDQKGVARGTLGWIAEAFAKSSQFTELSAATRRDYEYCRTLLAAHPTKLGIPLGDAPLDKWSRPMVQRLIDGITAQRGPSAASHALRYLRRLFKWAMNRGHATSNPAHGVEMPAERKQQRCPERITYHAVLSYAQSNAAPYLWIVMELAYLLRLRGIEIITLTDYHERPEGIFTERRKGSRSNLTKWNARLRKVWEAAKELRRHQRSRNKLPIPADPKKRWLFLSNDGHHLRRSALDTAWNRMIHEAIKAGTITDEQRFSLHDIKRAGVTRTKGTWHDKQEASGHKSDAMRDVYDKSVPSVMPTED